MNERNFGGLTGGMSGGLKVAAVGLLLHQLWKHAQGTGQPGSNASAAPAQDGGATTGGLGGLLGGLLSGGAARGDAAGGSGGGLGGMLGSGGLGGLLSGGLGGLLGGLGGLLGGARQHGMSSQVDSWVSSGPNQPASPQQLEAMFDQREVEAAARHAGTDRGTLMNEVGRVMPDLVDRMTPQGRLPQPGESVDPGLAKELRQMLGDQAPQRGA